LVKLFNATLLRFANIKYLVQFCCIK
jgi:hypothetical protein